ncbi:MAG: hypothetical protein ISR96_05555 [Nitrospira sp.]|nr:hypothetical protein [bacterium]MBL7048964.1 hypothetical protein [Nitrospira sp.]
MELKKTKHPGGRSGMEQIMQNRLDHCTSVSYAFKFGQIAVTLGFVTQEQVSEALMEQLSLKSTDRLRPKKLIGEILFENGWITFRQIEQVLEELFL